MEPDVLNEVCAKADAARIAQAQLAQTNTQRKSRKRIKQTSLGLSYAFLFDFVLIKAFYS